MGSEGKRIALWSFWTANLLVGLIYVLLSFATADNLSHASGSIALVANKDWSGVKTQILSNSVWTAPIAASVLGGIMVTMFNILSLVILIRKSINRTGPGFGYGFMMAWAFIMAFFTLLCGLILEGFKSVVTTNLAADPSWSIGMTNAFTGTYAMAYIACAMFFLFFLVLIIFQGAVTRELGIYDEMKSHKRLMEMNQRAGATALASQPDGQI